MWGEDMREAGLLGASWSSTLMSAGSFVVCLGALLYLRSRALARLLEWSKRSRWPASDIVYKPIGFPSMVICFVLSACFGVALLRPSTEWSAYVGHSLWTLSVLITAFAMIRVTSRLASVVGVRPPIPGGAAVFRAVGHAIIVCAAALVVLAVWGVPAVPTLLLVGTGCGLLLLGLRDAAPNLVAALHLVGGKHISEGEVVRLENGDEGRVARIGWISTHIQTTCGDVLVIPNSHLTTQRLTRIARRGTTSTDMAASVLTGRELEIARLMGCGHTNREIAEALCIAENTAKVHAKNILKKMELRSRQQLQFLCEGAETEPCPTD
jgi:DNA-binding CsgD family transcriptional regulator/small-conductance mechanosensitive channel